MAMVSRHAVFIHKAPAKREWRPLVLWHICHEPCQHPAACWIILIDIAIGTCIRSGLWSSIRLLVKSSAKLNTLQKRGLRSAIELIIFETCVLSLLIFPRRAILLSVTGDLYPSSASASLVPIVAFMILSSSLSYGLLSGTIHGYRDAVACALKGGGNLKTILCFYVLLMELAAIVKYIFFSAA